MKRIIYYILLLAGILGSSYFVLWQLEFIAGNTGLELMKVFIESIKSGSFTFAFDPPHIITYAIAIFLVVNAATLLTLLVVLIINLGVLSKVMKFYSISSSFFISAFILTAGFAYVIIEAGGDIMKKFLDLNLFFYLPIVASIVLMILGAILKKTERK